MANDLLLSEKKSKRVVNLMIVDQAKMDSKHMLKIHVNAHLINYDGNYDGNVSINLINDMQVKG